MRKLAAVAVIGLAALGLSLGLRSNADTSSDATPVVAEKTATNANAGPMNSRPVLAPEVLMAPEPEVEEVQAPLRRLAVRVSSQEQRPGEPDDQHARRLSWLERFESFERRAKMTPEQRAQLMQVLADKQEEAILSWEETAQAAREATAEDIERAIGDPEFDAFPSMLSMEKALQRDMWGQMRTFLNTKQMISFRRTSRINSVMGFGRWLPLDIEKTVAVEP